MSPHKFKNFCFLQPMVCSYKKLYTLELTADILQNYQPGPC